MSTDWTEQEGASVTCSGLDVNNTQVHNITQALEVPEGWQAPGLEAQRPRPSAPPPSAGHSGLLLSSLSSCAQNGCQEHIIAYFIHRQPVEKGTTPRNFQKGREAPSTAFPTSPVPCGTPHLQGCVGGHPRTSGSTVGLGGGRKCRTLSGRRSGRGCQVGRQPCPPQKMSQAGLGGDHRAYIHSHEGPALQSGQQHPYLTVPPPPTFPPAAAFSCPRSPWSDPSPWAHRPLGHSTTRVLQPLGHTRLPLSELGGRRAAGCLPRAGLSKTKGPTGHLTGRKQGQSLFRGHRNQRQPLAEPPNTARTRTGRREQADALRKPRPEETPLASLPDPGLHCRSSARNGPLGRFKKT